MSNNKEQVRVLRVLEYAGTRDFVEKSLQNRSVKSTMETPDGRISEAFVGGVLGFAKVHVDRDRTHIVENES